MIKVLAKLAVISYDCHWQLCGRAPFVSLPRVGSGEHPARLIPPAGGTSGCRVPLPSNGARHIPPALRQTESYERLCVCNVM